MAHYSAPLQKVKYRGQTLARPQMTPEQRQTADETRDNWGKVRDSGGYNMHGRITTSKQDLTCAVCNAKIKVGERIIMNNDDEAIHWHPASCMVQTVGFNPNQVIKPSTRNSIVDAPSMVHKFAPIKSEIPVEGSTEGVKSSPLTASFNTLYMVGSRYCDNAANFKAYCASHLFHHLFGDRVKSFADLSPEDCTTIVDHLRSLMLASMEQVEILRATGDTQLGRETFAQELPGSIFAITQGRTSVLRYLTQSEAQIFIDQLQRHMTDDELEAIQAKIDRFRTRAQTVIDITTGSGEDRRLGGGESKKAIAETKPAHVESVTPVEAVAVLDVPAQTETPVEWSWQPFGPDSGIGSFTAPGSHYRGFPVISVTDSQKIQIQAGERFEFKYKKALYVAQNGDVSKISDIAEEFVRKSSPVTIEGHIVKSGKSPVEGSTVEAVAEGVVDDTTPAEPSPADIIKAIGYLNADILELERRIIEATNGDTRVYSSHLLLRIQHGIGQQFHHLTTTQLVDWHGKLASMITRLRIPDFTLVDYTGPLTRTQKPPIYRAPRILCLPEPKTFEPVPDPDPSPSLATERNKMLINQVALEIADIGIAEGWLQTTTANIAQGRTFADLRTSDVEPVLDALVAIREQMVGKDMANQHRRASHLHGSEYDRLAREQARDLSNKRTMKPRRLTFDEFNTMCANLDAVEVKPAYQMVG